jgi:enoyl-CoA hydratase
VFVINPKPSGKRNALNNATLQCLCELLEEAEHNAQVKAVVLTGNAQCFAAGADLSELAAMDAVNFATRYSPEALAKN